MLSGVAEEASFFTPPTGAARADFIDAGDADLRQVRGFAAPPSGLYDFRDLIAAAARRARQRRRCVAIHAD